MPDESFRKDNTSRNDYLATARRILREVPLIDGHNDFPWMIRGWYKNKINSLSFDIDSMPIGQTDLTRLACGQLGGQFWSAFVPCPTIPEDNGGRGTLETLRTTVQQIDLIHLIVKQHPKLLDLVVRSEDILKSFHSGKIAGLIGIEGLHQIADSVSVLRMYHGLGVRYITLCHNASNAYADSATCSAQPHDGLSEAGKAIIGEMNRIGMMIDLSHTSERTQAQTLAISKAPVIFSHSSCFGVHSSPRNVSDQILSQLAANGGVIMICFAPSMIDHPRGQNGTVEQVADHIVYAGELIGFDHVGIGSDFDGMLQGPRGLEDVSCYPNLLAELLRRGLSEENIKLVIGLNIIRVMGEVEKVSVQAQQNRMSVLCDSVDEVWTREQRDVLIAQGIKLKNRTPNIEIE